SVRGIDRQRYKKRLRKQRAGHLGLRHQIYWEGQQPTPRTASPFRQMVRTHVVTPGYCRHCHPRLESLRDDPRFHIVRPASVAPASLHNRAPTNKSFSAICHFDILLKPQKKTRRYGAGTKPQISMGCRRRIQNSSLG
ncbi:hypothetical protein, partial [Falsigemmobacter intermedius]|uniref:hypothetical protein n=1 Tax=Falsigemmobacter intermedius TaxID=1553448 RepID=UPI00406BD8F8